MILVVEFRSRSVLDISAAEITRHVGAKMAEITRSSLLVLWNEELKQSLPICRANIVYCHIELIRGKIKR
jgi:hypothetical protein